MKDQLLHEVRASFCDRLRDGRRSAHFTPQPGVEPARLFRVEFAGRARRPMIAVYDAASAAS
jgi:hypothetical protein